MEAVDILRSLKFIGAHEAWKGTVAGPSLAVGDAVRPARRLTASIITVKLAARNK